MENTNHIPFEEYPDFYQGYVEKSKLVPITEGLVENFHQALQYFRSLPKNQWDYRYEKGKWSVKEVLLHLIDCERVFAYRALLMVRSTNPQLAPFDQDEFVENSQASDRTRSSLINEFHTLRKNTIVQFSEYSDHDLLRTGNINGEVLSVRAIGAIITGHTEHHLQVLKERYFNK